MPGQFITVRAEDGGEFRAYMAKPEKGSGPGLVLLQEIFGVNAFMRGVADLYAEEGYVVLCPDLFWRLEPGVELGSSDADRRKAFALLGRFDAAKGVEDIKSTVERLRGLPKVEGRIGALGFCLGGRLAYLAAAKAGVDVAVSYYGVGIEKLLDLAPGIRCPMVLHFAERDEHVPMAAVEAVKRAFAERPEVEIHVYPGAGHGFARPAGPHYDKPAMLMAHSRSLAALRRALGPHYDLGRLWEAHCYHEFAARDVPATMRTMVAEPYVNHIPTMTGGVGHEDLSRFYEHHFVNGNPKDTKLIPISRTVGADRLVDEMLFCFTHDVEIDWMLPGVEPTGKYVEVPLIAVVGFRGGKLCHEHIYWDQASVLVQIGLLDPKGLPVSGAEQARKLLDEGLPSNTLMARWATSAPKAAE
jgi:carboxymethylenebutenolidase